MNAIQINSLLLGGTLDIKLKTLSQGKTVIFRYANGTLVVVPSTGTVSNPVPPTAFKRIYDRDVSAQIPERTQVSYYNTPVWPDAPDKVYAPYIMRLIHFFETGN